MNQAQFEQLSTKMNVTLAVLHLALWRRIMMRRTTVFMVAVLVLLYTVHSIEEAAGPTEILGALRVLAQVLSGGAALFIAWLGTTSKIPSWGTVPVAELRKKD